MVRLLPLSLVALAALLSACDREPPPAPETSVAIDADGPASQTPDATPVTLTSNIAEAEVWQGDEKLGTVPHDVMVQGSASVTLRCDGHTSKDVELLAAGPSPVNVRLFPGVVDSDAPPAVADGPSNPGSEPHEDGPDPEPAPAPPDPGEEPEVEEVDAPAPPKDASQRFSTFKEIDDAYANGEITKARKKKETSRLKLQRLKEIEALKERVRNDELDEIEYGQEVRQLNIRYKG